MQHAVSAAVDEGFTHVAFGDLFLRDIRQYREERLAGSGLRPLFPLWDVPTAGLAVAMIDAGVRARIACVDTRIMAETFVGREFDRALLADLPSAIDPCGENGEFHTCVYAGPMFREPVELTAGERVSRDPFVWTDLLLES
jgi:diphthamide synthase (EF-2-diphthine--ammonia ligase)